jgi:hypothetical protein
MNTQVVSTLKGNSATIYIGQQVRLRQRKISRRQTQFHKFNPPTLEMCGRGSKFYLNFEKIKSFWRSHHSILGIEAPAKEAKMLLSTKESVVFLVMGYATSTFSIANYLSVIKAELF